jgi:hypothetical protein
MGDVGMLDATRARLWWAVAPGGKAPVRDRPEAVFGGYPEVELEPSRI